MSPLPIHEYCRNLAGSNIEQCGQCYAGSAFTIWTKAFYESGLMIAELCSRVLFSGKRINRISPFGYAVPNIIQIGSDEQMRWIYAWRVVAFMTDEKTVWNRCYVKFIREAMGPYYALMTNSEQSIAAFVKTPTPNPAKAKFSANYLAIFIDPLPKSLCDGTNCCPSRTSGIITSLTAKSSSGPFLWSEYAFAV
jgi:hypothetical protein